MGLEIDTAIENPNDEAAGKHTEDLEQGHKSHKCESCGKLFSAAQNLKNHIHTVHEGHKDYKCESCGKLFSQSFQTNH